VRDDINQAGQLEGHVFHVLRCRPAGADEPDEELAGLGLGAGHDQCRKIHGITADVARARELTSDADRQSGWAQRYHNAVVVVDQHVEVAGRAAGLRGGSRIRQVRVRRRGQERLVPLEPEKDLLLMFPVRTTLFS
jgi:hypothetical protein